MATVPRLLAGTVVALVMAAAPVPAQDSPPAAYRDALERLEAGDTAAAVQRLRSAVEEAPDFGRAHLRLGSLLTGVATEVETDLEVRREAEKHLARAVDLMNGHPEALLEYGLLVHKQHVRVDALRVLERAREEARARGFDFSERDRARLHFAMARIYETWWEAWRGETWIPPTAEPVRCFRNNRGAFADRAVSCPEDLWVQLQEQDHVSLEDQREHERSEMLRHLHQALDADPGHVDAATHLLGFLGDEGDWDAFMERARELVRTAPDDPRSWIFLGLGLHEQGQDDDEALEAFEKGIALLPEEERRVFLDVGPLLTEDEEEVYDTLPAGDQAEIRDRFFLSRDPLYLTEANERLLEHYSRVAWAELRFGAPASGMRGWETAAGELWIRYGRPVGRFSTGSLTFWVYGPRGPVFALTGKSTYGRTRMTDLTFSFVEDLKATDPEHYEPATITELFRLPHQVARFRGDRPGVTTVEVYARPPVDSLSVDEGAPLETGLFVFTAEEHEAVWQRSQEAVAQGGDLLLTYRLQLPEGRYRYGVEARLAGPPSLARPAARGRDTVSVPSFTRGSLAVSDLLLARDITSQVESPRVRDELDIRPNRTLVVEEEGTVHLYFEVYGLRTDSDGLGRYRARVALEDSTPLNFGERIVSAFAPTVIRPEEGREWVSWERTAAPVDDRTLDYLRIELPELDRGEHAIRLEITDTATGETVGTRRVFYVGSLPEPEPPPLRQPPLGD